MNNDSYYDMKLYSKIRENFNTVENRVDANKNLATEFENYLWKDCNLKFNILHNYEIQNKKNYYNNEALKDFMDDTANFISFLYNNINVQISFLYGNNNIFDKYINTILQNEMNTGLKNNILDKNFRISEYREISNINNIYHFIFHKYVNNKYILGEMTCLNSFSEHWQKIFIEIASSIKGVI